MPIVRLGSVALLLTLAACAGDPPGTVVVIDAQPWGRAHATAVEVIVWNAAGVEKSRNSFPLAGDSESGLPLRVWVRPRPDGAAEAFVVEARLLDASGAVLLEAVATGETAGELRTALFCIEDGCRGVRCSAALECTVDRATCARCVAGACAAAELVYGGAEACPTERAQETACFDGADDDRDDAVDCEDDDCDGRLCGDHGLRCVSGACACPGGGTETDCADGADDDCDGAADCADSDCASGTPCDLLGRLCSANECRCPGAAERCGNGLDDDCDGAADCDDDDCHVPGPETDCGNGVDDDCNGLTDCNDPACDRERCGTTHVCCGVECTDIARPPNCGGCGLACATGRACFINDRAGAVGWSCGCAAASDCPGGEQYCYTARGRCSCRNFGEGCDQSQECSREMDDWNFCYYPWNS